MGPFIVDPSSYDKQEAFASGLKYVKAFLDLNQLPHPSQVIQEATSLAKTKWRDYGWYDFASSVLFVNVKKSRVPVTVPGFSWSYTGFKSDLTAPGILAHEVGHHVHAVLEMTHDSKELRHGIKEIAKHEAAVSGYEPNVMEVFAEAVRLFILNPLLLDEGRPGRYVLLSSALGLRPLHRTPWREVLKNAHPRLIAAAENWITR